MNGMKWIRRYRKAKSTYSLSFILWFSQKGNILKTRVKQLENGEVKILTMSVQKANSIAFSSASDGSYTLIFQECQEQAGLAEKTLQKAVLDSPHLPVFLYRDLPCFFSPALLFFQRPRANNPPFCISFNVPTPPGNRLDASFSRFKSVGPDLQKKARKLFFLW